MQRYAAKLFFQYRVDLGSETGKRRLCEERIVLINATSAKSALSKAKRKGTNSEYQHNNDAGNRVYFEFIGVQELLSLDPECADDEVWYEIVERVSPLERREVFIPHENELSAIRLEKA
jgi:hypothetical protein